MKERKRETGGGGGERIRESDCEQAGNGKSLKSRVKSLTALLGTKKTEVLGRIGWRFFYHLFEKTDRGHETLAEGKASYRKRSTIRWDYTLEVAGFRIKGEKA